MGFVDFKIRVIYLPGYLGNSYRILGRYWGSDQLLRERLSLGDRYDGWLDTRYL